MTSEVDAIKTNEFLRRRKLRIQQVREQSKDIAKKIRQRASSEKLRHLVNLDANKEKEYLEQQDNLIKKLEQLHAKSVAHLGTSHRNAAEPIQKENKQGFEDVSKLRGRKAATELRRQKQDKLDERKKILDRKLQAREIANEISREKSSTVANKLSKTTLKSTEEVHQATQTEAVPDETTPEQTNYKKDEEVGTSSTTNAKDMATQWGYDSLPKEWEPNIPNLPLLNNGSPEETTHQAQNQPQQTKMPNLFALSEEMPPSLCGGVSRSSEVSSSIKPSLTLVSEYIQNRDLRLRDYDPKPSKRSTEDLQKLKQTILRSRESRNEVSANPAQSKKDSKKDSLEHILGKKSSVTMYNHSTRDVRDVPTDRMLVSRDHLADDDAYSQAMKETSSEQMGKDKEHQKKLQDMRNKIAVSKQSVEKEYKDTIAFLNSLPKEKTKPIKNAYKDAQQERLQLDQKQHKMQQEFRKILRECRKQTSPSIKHTRKTKFSSVYSDNEDDDFDVKDMQYSWMPVPESDKGLAVHIIPTKLKEQKSGNSVKFSKIDSYHEYRSRHKHTPPTKDTAGDERQKHREEASEDQDVDTSTSSTYADASSIEDLRLENNKKSSSRRDRHVEAEHILVYKILNSRSNKRVKVKKKHSKDCVAKSSSSLNKDTDFSKNVAENLEKEDDVVQQHASGNTTAVEKDPDLALMQLKEGIYKMVHKNGDNVSCVSFTDEQNKTNSSKAENNRRSDHTIDKENEETQKRAESQPTQSSSVSSFKTATNDKGDQLENLQRKLEEANSKLPGGYVRVVDQNGQESGKFFIGATGFLKDDAYEVIIKLRKSDTSKVDNVSYTKEQVTKDEKPVNQATETAVEHIQTETEMTHATSSVGVGEIKDVFANIPATVPPEQRNVIDKGQDAPFKDAFTCPKVNSEVKPVISVSVQTAPDSPEQRNRMSSSTSTAYMSPPEVILPRYLRRNYYEYPSSMSSYNREVCVLNHEPELQPKKKSPKTKPKLSPRNRNVNTPPNTARSFSDYATRMHICSPSKKKISPVIVPTTAKKHKCNKKRQHQKNSKACLKSNFQNTKRVFSTHLVAPPPSKNKLNPVVKRYVDKLLQLNKEGMTAVEVLNQDCSTVTTPGSSVINDFHNIDKKQSKLNPKISLEQIKQLIAQHIRTQCEKDILEEYETQETIRDTGLKENCIRKIPFYISKKRSVHKVKSLNISRNLFSKKPSRQKLMTNVQSSCPVSGTSSSRDNCDVLKSGIATKQKHRSKSSPSPRRPHMDSKIKRKTNSFDKIGDNLTNKNSCDDTHRNNKMQTLINKRKIKENENTESLKGEEALLSSWSCDESAQGQPSPALHSSTQTTCNIDEQITYVKMAEDKLQNMEKIADLTEKCTQRLSNLAKVLEEVRKNKLSYSQASGSASDTDQVSSKNSETVPSTSYEPAIEIKHKEVLSPPSSEASHSPATTEQISPAKLSKEFENVHNGVTDNTEKYSLQFKRPKSPVFRAKVCDILSPNNEIMEQHLKSRGKPPPALTRCLKRTQEYVVPHELSTVVEVDSPISIKLKSQSERREDMTDVETEKKRKSDDKTLLSNKNSINNPDLLENNAKQTRSSMPENTAENSKLHMMDLKQFNDIMLKPFISIQEYAKQCNVSKLEDGSNIETILKGDVIPDESSSLHSDGSLPDVIAELLKRNIITEPFKFETTSNVNSSVSSDSTLSVLALSKVKRSKKRTSDFLNKHNVEETSDTLSGSSNPDLENAFKKLGMGWASSTLKKTKERLALSSSSNTSSSSVSQFKLKTVQSKEFPVLVTDSISSIRNATTMTGPGGQSILGKFVTDNGKKTAAQQTSMASSLTVKEFLKNELAKRITFGEKSHTIDTEEEFVSLCETKMPEVMQRTPKHEERSIDSNPRARTSTPVQLFKSTTYHSSSSSHNGLFSNADDLSSVKGTSNSIRNRSSDKDDLTIPNFSLRTKKGLASDCSRSDD